MMTAFTVKDADLGRLIRRFTDLVRRVVDGSVPVSVALNYVQRAIDSSKPGARETVTFGGVVLTPELLDLPVVIYGKTYRRHPNGGGLVEETAEVDSTAYVAFHALVSGQSKVKERARIEDHAQVDSSEIFDQAVVLVGARLESCRVRNESKIAGKALSACFSGRTYVARDQVVEARDLKDEILGTPPCRNPWESEDAATTQPSDDSQ